MAQSGSFSRQYPTRKDGAAVAMRAFLKDDLPLIRRALIILAASSLFAASLISTSRTFMSQSRVAMGQAQAQRNDISNKRRQAEIDKQEILDYQAKYIQLRERGFLGEEKRLDWTEYIRQIRENRKLLPISYEISAQQPFQLDAGVSPGTMELRGSKIKLRMDLLHEGDLLNFLEDLSRKGFYTARACTIKRIGAVTVGTESPRLAAECILYLLTLGERQESPGGAPAPNTP